MLRSSGSQLGTVSGYNNGGEGATSVSRMEARDAVHHPRVHRMAPHHLPGAHTALRDPAREAGC